MFARIVKLLLVAPLAAAISTFQPTVKVLTSADGVKIYADAIGNPTKQSIVFVHGGSLSGIVYNRLFARAKLNKNFYLVRYDMRGHGRSGKPTTSEYYTQAAMAADFAAVLSAFNLNKPLFVGWSLGASIIGDIAKAFDPLPILGAVALGGCPVYGPELVPLFGGPDSALDGLYQDTNVTASILTHQFFVSTLFANPSLIPFPVRMEYLGQSILQTPTQGALFSPLRDQDRMRLLEVGESGELWLKVIFGSDDQIVLADPVERFLRPHFRHLEVMRLPGSHAVFEDSPDKTVDEIVEFVRKLRRRAT